MCLIAKRLCLTFYLCSNSPTMKEDQWEPQYVLPLALEEDTNNQGIKEAGNLSEVRMLQLQGLQAWSVPYTRAQLLVQN